MTITTKRVQSAHLQLNGFEVTIWECDRPEEFEYRFSIQRLNTDDVMDAFSYTWDEVQTVLSLTRWAEAHIASCEEEWP